MNKIYKVIWSKTRNCYVAVSEIAKRNGKSCTSVNCGAKANRRRVALALALSLWIAGGNVASAADPIVITSSTDSQIGVTEGMNLLPNNSGWQNYPVMKYINTGDTTRTEYYSLNTFYPDGNVNNAPDTLWFKSGDYNAILGTKTSEFLTICAGRRGSGLSEGSGANGRSLMIGSDSESPTFTGTNAAFYGGLDRGYTFQGDVKNNTVTMNGGTATSTKSSIEVYGGSTQSRYSDGYNKHYSASNNTVTINNFTFNARGNVDIRGGLHAGRNRR